MSDPVTPTNAERQRCEVWTRVMGYHRPVIFLEGVRTTPTKS